MKTLIAKQPLTGDYGHVETGEKFATTDDVAKSLIERELAEEVEADESEDKTDEEAEGSDDKTDKGATGRGRKAT